MAAASVSHERADFWIDMLASELVRLLEQDAGMTIAWSPLRNAIQREVTRQNEVARHTADAATTGGE
jgi:hypothetical protein